MKHAYMADDDLLAALEAGVSARVDVRPLTVRISVCAWCGAYCGHDMHAVASDEPVLVSHTVCTGCAPA